MADAVGFQSAICADMQCYRSGYGECARFRLVSVRYLRGYAVLPGEVRKVRRERVDIGYLEDWVRRESRSGPTDHHEKFRLFLDRLER